MNLMENIYKRQSVRKYKDEKVDKNTLKEIEALGNTNLRLYKDISMFVHIVEEGKKIYHISKGIIGSYGKIDAPHYLVITSEDKEGYLENIGFSLEHLVLQLTGMGIGTCWIGGHIKKELLNGIIELPHNHFPVIVISFGYPRNEAEVSNILKAGDRRKKVAEFSFGEFPEGWDGILNAVRRAPSAVNFQPWRFFKEGNYIHVFTVKRSLFKHLHAMSRIDAGIALCHLKVALEASKLDYSFEHVEGISKNGLTYITSVYIG